MERRIKLDFYVKMFFLLKEVTYRIDNTMTLSVFNFKTGELMNSRKSRYFGAPWSKLQINNNFLCVPSQQSLSFIKLTRGKVFKDFKIEDFRNCLLHSNHLQNCVYFVYQGRHPYILKLHELGFYTKFKKNLENLRNIQFISKEEILGTSNQIQTVNFNGIELLQSNSNNSKTESLVMVNFEKLDDSRNFSENMGVVELVKSKFSFVQIKHRKKKEDEKKLLFVLEDGSIYILNFHVFFEKRYMRINVHFSKKIFDTAIPSKQTLHDLEVKFAQNKSTKIINVYLTMDIHKGEENNTSINEIPTKNNSFDKEEKEKLLAVTILNF